MAIGTVVSWYSSTTPRCVRDLANVGPPWTRIVPSLSRAFSSAIAAERSPPKISAGPHSAFLNVWEKTAFGFSFIAVAIWALGSGPVRPHDLVATAAHRVDAGLC